MERSPQIAAHVRKVASERLGRDLVSKTGDLLPEELEEDKEGRADN